MHCGAQYICSCDLEAWELGSLLLESPWREGGLCVFQHHPLDLLPSRRPLAHARRTLCSSLKTAGSKPGLQGNPHLLSRHLPGRVSLPGTVCTCVVWKGAAPAPLSSRLSIPASQSRGPEKPQTSVHSYTAHPGRGPERLVPNAGQMSGILLTSIFIFFCFPQLDPLEDGE